MQARVRPSERPVVVAVCGDAGGASAVAPVLRALRAGGSVSVKALAYRQACAVWTRRAVAYEQVPGNIARGAVGGFLPGRDVALLLTGTSFEPSLEKEFIAAARERGVPSLAVLDFWSHYALRFSDADGRLAYVPDRIAVMDERARDEMTAVGFDPAHIVVTGNPAFDILASWRASFTAVKRRAVRDALGVGTGELLVVFGSQQIAFPDAGHPLYPGFTREIVLLHLITTLDQIAEQRCRKVVLAVRPHPSEEGERFDSVSRAARVRVIVARDGESRDLVLAADLVTGINSTLLIEACYLGCVTVSLQPGLRLPDALPTNRLGLSRAVYRHDEMRPALEEMLLDGESRLAARARLSSLQMERCATAGVVRLAYQMIKDPSRAGQHSVRCL